MILVSDGLSLAGLSVATARVGTAGRDRPEVLVNRVLTPTTDDARARDVRLEAARAETAEGTREVTRDIVRRE